MASCGAAVTAVKVVGYAKTAKAYADDYGPIAENLWNSLGGNQKKTMQWVKDNGGKEKLIGKYCVFTGPTGIESAGTYNGTIAALDPAQGLLVKFDDGEKKYKHAVTFLRFAEESERKEEPKANVESVWNSLRGAAKKTAQWVQDEGGFEKMKGKKAKWRGSSGFGSFIGTITGYDEKQALVEVTWDDGTTSMKYYTTFREWVK